MFFIGGSCIVSGLICLCSLTLSLNCVNIFQ